MKRSMRILPAVLALLFLVFSFPRVSDALEYPEISNVTSAILYNVDYDTVLYSLNDDIQVFPASSVKLMTAVLAYRELGGRMRETVTVTAEMLRNVSGYRIGLEAGEEVTIEALFYSMLLRGSNDSAYVLASLTAGSVESFVDNMNAHARELGMSSTVYRNPGGMHNEEMVTTVRDTLKIAKEFAGYTELTDMASSEKYVMPETNRNVRMTIYNKNALVAKNSTIKYYYEYAKGMNYGSTDQSGITVTAMSKHSDLTYICVIIGGEEDARDGTDYALSAARTLLKFANENYARRTVLDTSIPVCEIPVTLSAMKDHTSLYPASTFSVYLPNDVDPASDITYDTRLLYDSLQADVKEGMVCGYLNVYLGDMRLGAVDLVTAENIEKNDFLVILQKIKDLTKSDFFKAFVISFALLLVIYIFVSAAVRRSRSRRGGRYRF